MSVDFYSCEVCGESRHSDRVSQCNKCGSILCVYCLINDDINSHDVFNYGYIFDSTKPELMKQYENEGFSLYDEDNEPMYEDGDIIDDSLIDSKYCPYCSGTEINKEDLFNFIVKKYNLDINKEWKEYKNV